MVLYDNKKNCFGCGACFNICPKSAISMIPDEQGFLYPSIDSRLCVECGLCKKSCQIDRSNKLKNNRPDECFGFKNTDGVRYRSSSGGAYSAISDTILSESGICYGTMFSNSNEIIFQSARTAQERDLFLGSKYVQSNIGSCFSEIYKLLRENERVLFTGTPCQVAGLKQYLRARNMVSEKLLTVDLLCHGAPSPKLWKDYVTFLEEKNGGKLVHFTFRDKNMGWKGYHVTAEFDSGKIVSDSAEERLFLVFFALDVAIRPACFECPYACKERCGDVTIGDFWGLENIDKEFSDTKGVSIVIASTGNGTDCLNTIKENPKYDIKKYPYSSVSQHNLEQPTVKNAVTSIFWKQYLNKGFLWVARKYCGYQNHSKVNKLERSLMNKLHCIRIKRREK